MKIYMVRHGESEGNRDNKFRGRADHALTELGRKQAAEAADYLRNVHFDAIFSSPLSRAYETALIIAEGRRIKVEKSDALNNVFLEEWEDKSKEMIKVKYPEEWKTWLTNPEELKLGSMETLDDIMRRTVAFAEGVAGRNEGNVLFVTHRAVIKPMISGLIGVSRPYFWRLHIDMASVSILQKNDDGRGWMLKALNINHYLSHFKEENS